nr:ERF family protein [uncultured Haemophilus sp.]
MSIYSKLAQARVRLQEKGLAKSGKNSYSKYTYFELGDFLPEINRIFAELGLCSVVSFTKELATLTLYDSESDGKIEFTSPMAKAELKGCHEIQNLGAVETYQRRYLYMTALEIVEGDLLDENTGNEKTTPKPPQNQKSQGNYNKPTSQNTPSTPPPQKPLIERLKDGLRECKTQKALDERYSKQLTWLEEHHPDLIDGYNSFYDECLFNLTT